MMPLSCRSIRTFDSGGRWGGQGESQGCSSQRQGTGCERGALQSPGAAVCPAHQIQPVSILCPGRLKAAVIKATYHPEWQLEAFMHTLCESISVMSSLQQAEIRC